VLGSGLEALDSVDQLFRRSEQSFGGFWK
jgi:hypothetical protein